MKIRVLRQNEEFNQIVDVWAKPSNGAMYIGKYGIVLLSNNEFEVIEE